MRHDSHVLSQPCLVPFGPVALGPCPLGAATVQERRTAVSVAYAGDVGDRIRRFLPLVKRMAWHVHGTGRPGIEIDDLMQAGLVALTECANRHVGPGEDGFAAYAKLRVRGAMIDLVRRGVPLSRGVGERRRMLRDKEHELRNRLGREPHAAELAAALGVTQGDLAGLRAANAPLRFDSLDEVYSDTSAAFTDDRPDSLELLVDAELRGQVANAIARLPERLQLVIQLYFVEELNLAEIAQVLGVSVPRVSQIKSQAIGHLRDSLESVAQVL